ncbi:MAG: type II toxin-antitoxin system RelE/ParE family toxin [Rhizonema sp. PD38]|nr:type II toxin-antitoxin system RelE/ParE family toxin [Rhizonema sp. PD38]
MIITPEAQDGIRRAYEWIVEYSPNLVSTWMNGLFQAILSLERMPLRCPLAFENDLFDEELRQLLYGKKGKVYRILTIRRSEVYVLFVRHSAQKPLFSEEE